MSNLSLSRRGYLIDLDNPEESLMSYGDYREMNKEYDGTFKCFVHWCDNPAFYEGGDGRFKCGMCEEHVELKEQYLRYINDVKHLIRVRMLWDKDHRETLEKALNKCFIFGFRCRNEVLNDD